MTVSQAELAAFFPTHIPEPHERDGDAAPTVPGYILHHSLGRGGMGVVYKAHDIELDDVVALKMLRPGVLVDSEQLERLKSEIKLARRITHPNVLRTFGLSRSMVA